MVVGARRKGTYRPEWLILAVLITLTVVVRLPGLHHETSDMVTFEQWYHQLLAAGRWHGLGLRIGNYNAPFLYLLDVASLLPGPVIVKIKLVWMVFDVLLAYFTYTIVRLKWDKAAPISALIVLFLPTVVINASFYGQADAMWASFALGGICFLIRDRPWWGVSFCAVAIAVKPQGVFVLPLLALLVLAGRIPWRSLLALPAVYLALDVPALLAGRDPIELLTVYSLHRQSAWVDKLTWNAPSAYAFVKASGGSVEPIKQIGYVLCAALVLGVCYVLVARAVELTPERIVTAATLFAIMTPFLLPGMHERYFFLADVLSVVLVFFRPRLWCVPLLVESASLLSYEPYLFGTSAVPLPVAASLMLVAVVVTTYQMVAFNRRDAGRPESPPARPA